MPSQGWQSTIVTAQADGSALSTSTTKTSILPAASRIVIPPGYFNTVGQMMKITAQGRVSNIITTPGTLTFTIHFGTVASPVVLFASQALALNAVAKTNVTWWLELLFTLRANTNTTSNFMAIGTWQSEAVIGSPLPSAGGSGTLIIPASAPAVSSNFDNQAAHTIDLMATFSISNAGNSIQTHMYKVENIF